MGFGRAGGSSATVPTRSSAQKNHHISGKGALPPYIFCRGRRNHRTDFHTLRRIPLMINLIHNAGCQSDLVPVRGISGGGRGHQLPLGQFPRQGL